MGIANPSIFQIIDWLSLPANERPALIMAYFDQPDTAGHFQEVDSDVDTQLQGVDLMLNYLLNTLNSKQLLDCINIVILSDHGMKLIENRFYIDDFVDTTGMIVANGVVARIDLNSSSMSIDELMGKLKCINNGKLLREYSRKTIPSRYHYSTSNRIGDLVLDGQLGTAIYRDRKSEFLLAADHGYDYLGEDMRAIFFAQGPSIKKKIVLKPFQNIEYYNLFAELLGITRIPPNNGTKGRLDSVLLLGGTTVENRSSVSIADCPSNVVEQIRNRRLQTASCQFLRNEIELSKNSGMLPPNISSLISEQDGYNRSCLVSNNRNELMIVADSTKVAKSPIYTIDILDKTEPNRINEAKSSLSCAWTGNIRRMRNDTFSYLEQFTYRSAIKFGRIVTISGPIFSKDEGLIKSNENASTSNVEQKPSVSHVFRVLIRCTDSLWIPNGLMCKHPSNIRFAAFIMPNRPDDPNCVSSNEYLLAYSVRLRDVELLTHLEFFADRRFIDRHSAVELRTDIMTNIWEV
ncbi:hypothetical protein AB6A40_003254 [Gnathostoma spinigerum]|uniref:ENPP1-3/EXOG-like endonuclease/phosphodiesterase domain-containing protein n=1 Tax=Gnathostoma spinigerum TaxID=75299 RepID=A0ABD6EJU5_9BILA